MPGDKKRFAEYLTDVGKRLLKEDIPTDQHLFPDKFHEAVQSEHDHSKTNSKVFSQPKSQNGKGRPNQPFRSNFRPANSGQCQWESASGLTGADHCKPLSQQSNILQAEGHQPSFNDFPKAPPSQVAADYILTQMKHINPPDNQVAGRLKYFVDNWKIITSDKTILETVQGYQIPFILRPHQWRKRITKPKLKEGNMFLEAIDDLLAKGAIKETLPVQDEFLSTVFLVKQSTKTRPIFNLKSLNQFIRKEKFKLEGLLGPLPSC